MKSKAATKHLWNEQPAYKKWVLARDRGLEKLHTRSQKEMSDVMRKLLTDVLIAAKASYPQMKAGSPYGVDQFEHVLKYIFNTGIGELYQIMLTLRTRSYTLAKASEAEIIARMSHDKTVHATVRHDHLQHVKSNPSVAGGNIVQRLQHYLDKLRRKIVTMAQGSALNAPDVTAFLIDVRQAFPKSRIVRRPVRNLKPKLMEAGPHEPWSRPDFGDDTTRYIGTDDVTADVAIDNIDTAAWDDMRSAYMDEYVPKWRDPAYVVDLPIADPTVQADGTEVYYAWEFERDMTDEFVQAVRDGQVDAANENGITDFVVISIIDDKTCDTCCGDFGCVDFDGILVSEVEELTGGDQSTPSYHPNCRCTLAPATDNIPDKPDTMASDFEDWLDT